MQVLFIKSFPIARLAPTIKIFHTLYSMHSIFVLYTYHCEGPWNFMRHHCMVSPLEGIANKTLPLSHLPWHLLSLAIWYYGVSTHANNYPQYKQV